MKIIAFDPGGTTGFAKVVIPEEKLDVGQLLWNRATIWYFLNNEYPDQVVYEKFFYQRRDKVDLRPVEVIGIIELWCELNAIPVVSYSAATAKNFWTDAKMRKVGGWFEGMPHATDATRHLLYHRLFAMKHDYILKGLRD